MTLRKISFVCKLIWKYTVRYYIKWCNWEQCIRPLLAKRVETIFFFLREIYSFTHDSRGNYSLFASERIFGSIFIFVSSLKWQRISWNIKYKHLKAQIWLSIFLRIWDFGKIEIVIKGRIKTTRVSSSSLQY